MVFCSPYPKCIAILQKAMQSLLKNPQNTIQTEEIIKYEKIVLVGGHKLPVSIITSRLFDLTINLMVLII